MSKKKKQSDVKGAGTVLQQNNALHYKISPLWSRENSSNCSITAMEKFNSLKQFVFFDVRIGRDLTVYRNASFFHPTARADVLPIGTGENLEGKQSFLKKRDDLWGFIAGSEEIGAMVIVF